MLALLLFVNQPVHAQAVFDFESDSLHISDGYLKLEWSSTDNSTDYELSQSRGGQDYRVIYTGPDRATFVSGLANGAYKYKIRTKEGEWSKPLIIIVQHQSLKLAMILCGIGLFVFIAIVLVVLIGIKQNKFIQV